MSKKRINLKKNYFDTKSKYLAKNVIFLATSKIIELYTLDILILYYLNRSYKL